MVEANQDADGAQLRRQVGELADRTEIANLIGRLGLWLDEKRFDEAQSIFTADAAAQTSGGTARGIELVADQARRNHADFERTQHVIANVLTDLDGDRATVRANLIATFVHHADAPRPTSALGERYRFEAVRTPQGWRLSRVQTSPVWRSDSKDGGSPTQANLSAGSGR
jgi:hypothetical protein